MNFLGLSFNALALQEVRDALLARPPEAQFGYVVTPNVDHLDRLRRNPALKPVYDAALLRLFDSRCLFHAARLLGHAPPPVVTGADLTAALLPHLGGRRVAVVGLNSQVFAALRARYPAIEFRHHNPPMGLLENPEAFSAASRFARGSGASFIFFAVGSPTQEALAHALWREGEAAGVGLCIGAALEFAAGTRRRAPGWMRRAGLEWLFRLALEPRRLAGRYLLRGPLGVALLLAQDAGFRARSSE